MTQKQIITAFINIAREIYESAHGDNAGEEVEISANMADGKKIVITIREEGSDNYET